MDDQDCRLSADEFRLVAHLLALSVSPPWMQTVLRVLTLTGPGQGAKAAAELWRVLPVEEVERLETVYDRLLPPEEWRKL